MEDSCDCHRWCSHLLLPVLKSEQLPSWANLELYNQRNFMSIFFPEKDYGELLSTGDVMMLCLTRTHSEEPPFLHCSAKEAVLTHKTQFVVSRLAEKLGAVIEGDEGGSLQRSAYRSANA